MRRDSLRALCLMESIAPPGRRLRLMVTCESYYAARHRGLRRGAPVCQEATPGRPQQELNIHMLPALG